MKRVFFIQGGEAAIKNIFAGIKTTTENTVKSQRRKECLKLKIVSVALPLLISFSKNKSLGEGSAESGQLPFNHSTNQPFNQSSSTKIFKSRQGGCCKFSLSKIQKICKFWATDKTSNNKGIP
ncbi:hypothetical protein [Caldithrix abyssi]|uniref:hypothetical protein n=1 Tax=Caldithrix abyssi TaxID=187145 RepID=UPI0005C530D0|nr:hypothetical protein [Caldithrix abyssi]